MLQWLKRNAIDPETRSEVINLIYGIIAMVFLMQHIVITFVYPKYLNATFLFSPYPFLLFAIISVVLGRMWKDKGFFLLLILIIIKTARIWAELGYCSLPGQCLYAFGGCYAIGRVYTESHRKQFLIAFCSIWTAAMVVLSVLSIYVAWTKIPILNYGNGAIGFEQGYRLSPVYFPVHAGAIASASIAVSLIAVSIAKKKIIKILFLTSGMIIFVLGILTTSRSNHIVNAALLAMYVVITIYKQIKKRPRMYQWAGLLVLGIIVFIGFSYVQSWGIRIFNYVSNTRGILISNAFSESTGGITPRDLVLDQGVDSFLNGRIDNWESLIWTFKANPSFLFWGSGNINPYQPVNEIRASLNIVRYAHTHNAWFQMLLENGLPGFLLYVGFTIYVIRAGFKLIINKNLPFWGNILPFPVIACMLADIVDITGYPDRGLPASTILFFFAGLIVVYYQELKDRTE